MHNHFAVKFLALLLTVLLLCTCAVTGIGILALNETGLYRQSVEEAYLEYIRGHAQSYGDNILHHSLSQDLGGATPEMTEAFYGSFHYYGVFNWGKVGYTLRDESGQVIEYREMPGGEKAALRFSIPATGTYLKIHDTVTPDEYEATVAAQDRNSGRGYAIVAQEYMILDTIPPEGAEIHNVSVSYIDSSEGVSSPESLGTLRRNAEGRAVFTGNGELLEPSDRTVTHILFENNDLGILYEASCPTGVGVLYDDGTGNTVFEALVAGPQFAERGISADAETPEASLPAEYQQLRYYDGARGTEMVAMFTLEPMPAYTVEVVLAENALYDEYGWVLLRLLYQNKDRLLPVLGVSLVLLIFCTVYLCCAAARKPGTEDRRAGGMNRFPLDAYGLLAFGGMIALALLGVEGIRYLMDGSLQVALWFGGTMLFLAATLLVAFCFAFVAQLKTPEGYFWSNSLCFRVLNLGIRLGIRGFRWLLPLVRRTWRWTLGIIRGCVRLLVRILRRIWRSFANLVALLPLAWQWFLGGIAMMGSLFIAFMSRSEGMVVLSIVFCVGLIFYGTRAFGILLAAVKRMGRGELDRQVEDPMLIGSFREFGDALNSLAGVAVVAAQKQLKSERMKTELITNVSHDIKTPLTSIINYVDLLEKPHTEEQRKQYLEVLSRQSQRLKKLIDDLMEMSKASSGNMAVEIITLDAGETVYQALGEFSEKLEKAGLVSVFHKPEEPIFMKADGALAWRVLSNLLGNAVKYALPGTRLYLDLTKVEGNVVISMKNISREELNVEAEELLERFVRGDISRNTEGSGLGLNIAKSLMELQHGTLNLLVDGDLFKVTLIFPAA